MAIIKYVRGDYSMKAGAEYQSETYYDVVIRSKSYKGWTAPDVGMGAMRFIHPKHGEFRVNKGSSHTWMLDCWEDFLDFVEKLEVTRMKNITPHGKTYLAQYLSDYAKGKIWKKDIMALLGTCFYEVKR